MARVKALERFRIVDFGGVLAGAGATRILAAFGADVIRVEDPTNQGRWDVIRGSPPYPTGEAGLELSGGFNNHNAEKRGVTLNLKSEGGRQLLRKLIAVSDVVTENFAAGVFARLGFDYPTLRSIRPDIIYVSNCGFGHSGPYEKFKTWGPIVQAIGGLTFTSGLPDQPPAGWGYSYMDHTGAYYMALAVLMALYRREQSGEGQWVDLAMTEAAVPLCGPVLLDYSVNGRRMRRPGVPHSNRSDAPAMAPHGIYAARGEDEWIAIACRDDADWQALRGVIDRGWCREPELDRLASRLERQDALDEALGAWTRERDKYDMQAALLGAGVPAAAVQRPDERIDADPNTAEWGLWPTVTHPEIGKQRVDGLPVHLSETDASLERGAPRLGEHNAEVFGELLGLDDAELEKLRAEAAI
jgi:crotonobetainyl-CoA:carnitine CoA-transferase CaiB-like acyl-CoA transferase